VLSPERLGIAGDGAMGDCHQIACSRSARHVIARSYSNSCIDSASAEAVQLRPRFVPKRAARASIGNSIASCKALSWRDFLFRLLLFRILLFRLLVTIGNLLAAGGSSTLSRSRTMPRSEQVQSNRDLAFIFNALEADFDRCLHSLSNAARKT
jgi:hypothetical protein